jgi:hypothetical protein
METTRKFPGPWAAGLMIVAVLGLLLTGWLMLFLHQSARMHPAGSPIAIGQMVGCWRASWSGPAERRFVRLFPRDFALDTTPAEPRLPASDTLRIMVVRPLPSNVPRQQASGPGEVVWVWRPRSVTVVSRDWPYALVLAFSLKNGRLEGAGELRGDVISDVHWPEWDVVAQRVRCPAASQAPAA